MYYYCVNCGKYVKAENKKVKQCENCNYENILELDEEEYNDHFKEIKYINDRFNNEGDI